MTPGDDIHIRPWAEGDDLKLLEVFADVASPQQAADRLILARATTEPFGITLVAERDGIAIAAGGVREQPIHPQRHWVYLETAPLERRQGIAGLLLERLGENIPAGSELKARSVAGDTATESFLTRHGFSRINTARRVLIGPGGLQTPTFSENGEDRAPVLEELGTGSVELSQAVATFYNAVHASWDPSEISLTKAQQLFLAPETAATGAVVVRDRPKAHSGTIQAFAISYLVEGPDGAEHDERQPAEVLMGWNPEAPDPHTAVRNLLAMLTGTYPIQLETDESLTALNPVIDELIDSGYATVEATHHLWATDG
ncbi:GNAT family N-acetyltransferase [Auritidibacter ignavus]|uniref:GNAT family N-acetyltransferase n=1 Tax=Auritidibacter ignavus TaxID=678932 RepID=UPI0024B8FFF0|nr:GNAT family N-acetyltransferase [Auritidibacter ignavus]WHS27477.1 GNAT family N-acetyltransferase [Auritidibacter ignavus]